jgi:preprotein translocase subunit YajC
VELTALLLQPTGAKASPGSPAPAQPQAATPTQGHPEHAQQQPPSMGLLGSPLFLVVLFLPFIFLMWRRNKKENEARAKLKKGDKVVAGGGLVGEITDVDDRIAKVKVAPGVTVQVLTHALSPFEEPAKAGAKKEPEPKPKADKGKAT